MLKISPPSTYTWGWESKLPEIPKDHSDCVTEYLVFKDGVRVGSIIQESNNPLMYYPAPGSPLSLSDLNQLTNFLTHLSLCSAKLS